MKTLDDLLNGYLPHRGDTYNQTYVVPGTVDPEIPDHNGVMDDATPEIEHAEARLHARHGFNELMDALWSVVHHPDYETDGPFTAGGKSQASLQQIANETGVGSIYTIVNPFDTDAEYCVVAASFGAAGQAILSRNSRDALGPALTQFYNPSSYVRGIPFFASGVVTFPLGIPVWFPIPASDQLYWAVNMTAANTDSALVTVAFRRRINRHGKYELTVE